GDPDVAHRVLGGDVAIAAEDAVDRVGPRVGPDGAQPGWAVDVGARKVGLELGVSGEAVLVNELAASDIAAADRVGALGVTVGQRGDLGPVGQALAGLALAAAGLAAGDRGDEDAGGAAQGDGERADRGEK